MVKKVPKVIDESKKAKLSRRFNKLRMKASDIEKKGVVYVGHLPKGFNETELKKFFT